MSDPAIEAAWDALKSRCCADPANATQCVMVRREPFEAAITAYLAAKEAQGFVMVPVALLERCRDREYNPFEPDNQTKLHDDLSAMIAARPQIGGTP